MKHYVTFKEVISAIIAKTEITINGQNISFYHADNMTTGFAKIYSDIADMSGIERNKIISRHKFNVYRIIRSITTELLQITKTAGVNEWETADKYTRLVLNLLSMGIAPTPDIFNIVRNTGVGMLFETTDSAGEKAIQCIMNRTDNCHEVINIEFFEEYVAIRNMDTAAKLNEILNTALPTNVYRWLSRYTWNDFECEYVANNFSVFITKYESVVIKHA